VVFIIIAVQQGLDSIKKQLASRGYRVVELETNRNAVDAIIYQTNLPQISYFPYDNLPAVNDEGKRKNYGALIINSSDKGMEEIENILKTRCYSRLFNQSVKKLSNYN
jgi:hypothetical protein